MYHDTIALKQSTHFLYNPILQWGLLAMFLYNNVELVNEQLIGKCLTLNWGGGQKQQNCLSVYHW